jgi:hypothetical protein
MHSRPSSILWNFRKLSSPPNPGAPLNHKPAQDEAFQRGFAEADVAFEVVDAATAPRRIPLIAGVMLRPGFFDCKPATCDDGRPATFASKGTLR